MGVMVDGPDIKDDRITASALAHLPQIDPPPLTIDELVRGRVRLSGDDYILAYASSGIDYVDYTPRQIDTYAYHAGLHYAKGMPQRSSSSEQPRIVGLLGPSNLDYVVSMFALTKIGHTVLYLSPRISKEAHQSLLEKTGARDLIIHESFRPIASSLQQELADLRVHTIAGPDIYNKKLPEGADTRMDHQLDPHKETNYPAWIIHSSGSTSLPKPVYLYHRAVLSNYSLNNIPLKGFVTMPLYHSHGVATLCKAFFSGKQVHLYNANLPLAKQHLVGTLEAHEFQIFHGVPYSLKLLAEDDRAIDLLAKCEIVMYGGSACPDELGDLLTKRGVTLVSHYGTTETGQLMSSERPKGDMLWNWVRPGPQSRHFIKFEDRGSGLLEIICLPGWPGKVMTNREDGSYATRDLFIKHPTMEAYKYFSRLDDTINLVNGEKANPLLIEGLVRQNLEVREAVVFGAGRSELGVLLFPSAVGAQLSRDELLDRIWPSFEKAHKDMPNYSHISREMVRVMPGDASYAATDKGTIIRQAIYHQYASEIDSMYEDKKESEGDLSLKGEELEVFIQQQVQTILNRDETSFGRDSDFFELGMDSLQAAQLRTAIARHINLNGQKLGLNIAFDCPSVRALARKLEHLRAGTEESTSSSIEEEMESLVSKYGTFTPEASSPHAESRPDKHHVLVTGATGSLGAHVVSILANDKSVQQIWCPVRASSREQARSRVQKSLEDRRLWSDLCSTDREKIIALPSDLSQPTLGLQDDVYKEISDNVTAVIHSAWSVNFNLRLKSFERDCISAARNLIDLCRRSRYRADFNFCSSVSTAVATPGGQIPEALPESFKCAQNMGYAQAKLVTEHVCMNAAAQCGLKTRVLRIGQISGDTKHGMWNATEAQPLIFRSALTTGVLPEINETPRWLPVDVVARTVVELSLPQSVPSAVYNVINPSAFHWTRDLLPRLRMAGLKFERVAPQEWLKRLRGSNPDPEINPPYKLLDFFAKRYGGQASDTTAPSWDTQRTQTYSDSFREAPALRQDLVDQMVRYWTESCWTSK